MPQFMRDEQERPGPFLVANSLSKLRFDDTSDESIANCLTLGNLARAINSHKNVRELFHKAAIQLHTLLDLHYLSVTLHDTSHNVMRLHTLECQPGTSRPDLELSMEDSASAWVWRTQQELLIGDTARENRFPHIKKIFSECGVKSWCGLPLSAANRRLGTINFGAAKLGAYNAADLKAARLVATWVATGLENALNCEAAQTLQRELARERDRLRFLLDLNTTLVSHVDLEQLLRAILASIRSALQCDAALLSLPEGDYLRVYALEFSDGRGKMQDGMLLPIADSHAGEAFRRGSPVIVRGPRDPLHPAIRGSLKEGVKSGCFLPLRYRERVVGVLHLLGCRENLFGDEDVEFLSQVDDQIAIAIANTQEYRELEKSSSPLPQPEYKREGEFRAGHNFKEIIGESPSLLRALKQVEMVAPTNSTVLILGETGTGKELIARAVHKVSDRRQHTFVRLNCAAIPTGLLESELFGHEKGAFTGAVTQKIGRFELAHKGTLFLDEVGDIPLELQPKLLRVLQEQEFERLGSTKTQSVDVRIIAATNMDLEQLVSKKQFRSDLYHRLDIFPISVPPLRERLGDIPRLVRHFVAKHARENKKTIDTIPPHVMKAFTEYHWPGNVRELQNFVERSVILSPGNTLCAPVPAVRYAEKPTTAVSATLEEAEREYIMRTLEEANWVVGGPRGAAARLGLKRTTLLYKMQKLGITRAPEP